jgi:hypothetical protein
MSDLAIAARPGHNPGTLRLGGAIFEGEVAELVKQEFTDLARVAYQAQGIKAFEDPKSAAVVHEAGHAVLCAYSGLEMRFLKVWQCKKGIQRGHWVGKFQPVEDCSWSTGPDTPPGEDLKNACTQIAGWMAEVLFDHDNLRPGSSLDEVIKARLLSSNFSHKTGADPKQVLMWICSITCSILKKNESVVREIASILDRDGVIRREALSAILANVERPSLAEIQQGGR